MTRHYWFLWTLVVLLGFLVACNGEDDSGDEDGILSDGDGETTVIYPDGDENTDDDDDDDIDEDGDLDDEPLTDGDILPDGDEELSDTEQDEEESGCIQDPDGDEDSSDDDDDDDLDGDAETDDDDDDLDGDAETDDDDDDLDGDADSDDDDDDDIDGDEAEAEGELEDEEESPCPADMAAVSDNLCMDRYEASRPDASAVSGGSDTSYATSRLGVIPWYPVTLPIARAACENAGKRLCSATEWETTCHGEANTVYNYGDEYIADICNGIDAFCYCDEGSVCAETEVCPYPHCRSVCGANFHSMPTGSFAGCVTSEGLVDLHGNVWELVDAGDDQEHYRGGAYNCSNSELLHRCDYDGRNISAKGFRCCKDLP